MSGVPTLWSRSRKSTSDPLRNCVQAPKGSEWTKKLYKVGYSSDKKNVPHKMRCCKLHPCASRNAVLLAAPNNETHFGKMPDLGT